MSMLASPFILCSYYVQPWIGCGKILNNAMTMAELKEQQFTTFTHSPADANINSSSATYLSLPICTLPSKMVPSRLYFTLLYLWLVEILSSLLHFFWQIDKSHRQHCVRENSSIVEPLIDNLNRIKLIIRILTTSLLLIVAYLQTLWLMSCQVCGRFCQVQSWDCWHDWSPASSCHLRSTKKCWANLCQRFQLKIVVNKYYYFSKPNLQWSLLGITRITVCFPP